MMPVRFTRVAARRLLLTLTALVACAWVASYVIPREVAYRSTPQPAPESDLAPTDKYFLMVLVSERGEMMFMRSWEYQPIPRAVEHFSLSRPEFDAQTVPYNFINRLGFELFSGDDTPYGGTGIILPFWLLFLLSLGLYMASVLRNRRTSHGFPVQASRTSDSEK